MEEFYTLNADQWVGFATRRLSLHWLRGTGFGCAILSGLVIMICGLPLLSSTRDPDYDSLKHQVPNMIEVQVVVNLNPNAAAPTQSLNAGVIGVGLFGAVGGVVGSAIQEEKEQRQRQEQAAQQAAHEEAVRKLFQKLEPIGAEFGWTTKVVRNAV